jgi:hypothetical protein
VKYIHRYLLKNYEFLIFLSLRYENKIGRIIRVRAIEVMSHHTTTIAKGFCNSLPVPVLQIIGKSPITEVNAVIRTGRSRIMAPSTTDSCIHCFVIFAPSSSAWEIFHLSISGNQNFSLKAFSK